MITTTSFGVHPSGAAVERVELSCGALAASILTHGATLQSLHAPGRDGEPANVVLGYPDLDTYLGSPGYLGATIGRYGNRIADAAFELDGVTYRLGQNFRRHNLHGGPDGFDARVWTIVDTLGDEQRHSVTLALHSPDGDQGFPGALAVEVTYALSPTALTIGYSAEADRPTVVNLTNHSYFNLTGVAGGDVLGHDLGVAADRFLPVDDDLIPTGELRPVDGTAFDLREPRPIGDGLAGDDPQLESAGGYDHCFVLAAGPRAEPQVAAVLSDPAAGRSLEVSTTEPAVQVYTGNNLDNPHAGVCLETQHFPNSPNEPGFPSTVVSPDAPYRSQTTLTFHS